MAFDGVPSPALVPLYRRVSEDLAQAILGGTIAAGAPVPTEEALCTRYGVSRITVRKALDELALRRLVVRRRGVGTFAGGVEQNAKSVMLTGYIEEVLSPNRFVMMREAVVRLPAPIAEYAHLPGDMRVHLFEGVNYLADGAPLAHLCLYYPIDIGVHLSARALAGPLPPIKYLEQALGLHVHHANQIVVPASVTGRIAKRMRLKTGTPVLRATRVYYAADGKPLELFDAHYHPDHYRYNATLYPRAGYAAPPRNVPASESFTLG